MAVRAVIFDLDDTLVDSSALQADRDARRWQQVFQRLDEVKPFAVADIGVAVADLPHLVGERGLKVGLLTHSPADYATQLLDAYGISVQASVSGSDGYEPKPDPAGLRAVLAGLDVEPEDALYVGDSIADFGAAAAAGVSSVGVSWDESSRASWRHVWPDFAVGEPRRLLELIDGCSELASWAEVFADGHTPAVHWGSLLRLGAGVYGLGRYFPLSDQRYPGHALSHLVLAAKEDQQAAEQVADIFKAVAEHATTGHIPQLILSVPPEQGNYDRFAPARSALAEAWEARDGGGLLRMNFAVEDYKQMPHDQRIAECAERFSCEPLNGERSVLIDDVLTSGAQSEACRAAIKAAAGGPVTILVLSVAQEPLTEQCPRCNSNLKTRTRHSDGKQFIGCSGFFRIGCTYTRDIP